MSQLVFPSSNLCYTQCYVHIIQYLILYNKFPCVNKDFPNIFLTQLFVCKLQVSKCTDKRSCRTFLWKLINLAYKINYQIMWKHTVCNIIRMMGKTDVTSNSHPPIPPHVLCGLRGPPSWAWQACNRLLRLGRPWGTVTLSRWCVSGDRGGRSARKGLKPKVYYLPRPRSPWESSLSRKIPTVEPGIEPGTSWLVVRDPDH